MKEALTFALWLLLWLPLFGLLAIVTKGAIIPLLLLALVYRVLKKRKGEKAGKTLLTLELAIYASILLVAVMGGVAMASEGQPLLLIVSVPLGIYLLSKVVLFYRAAQEEK